MKRWKNLLLVSILALGPGWASGAQVTLKTGEVLKGEILEETATSVRIRTTRTTLTITRDRIQNIVPSQPGEMEAYKAQDLLLRGQLDEALAALREAEKVATDKATLDELRKSINEAITRRDLQKYRTLLADARSSANRGVESPALAEIRKILAGLPPDSPTRTELIDVLCDFHEARAKDASDKVRYSEAVTELRSMIELDPNRPDPHLGLGDLYRGSSATWNEAIHHYRKALDLGSERLPKETVTKIYWELGELYRQQRKYREACVNYREAYKRDPQISLRLTDRMLEVMNEYATEIAPANPSMALMVIDEALKVRQTPELHLRRAELLAANKQWDASNESIRAALAITPRIREAHYRMALNFYAKGEILETRANLEREIANFPGHYEALCLLGSLALQRDDNEAAEKFFTSAVNVDGDRPAASLGLSRVFRRNKDLVKAKSYAEDVLLRFPEDRSAHLEMGNIYLDEGNLEEARRYFTSVLELVDRAIKENKDAVTMLELKQLKADALLARGEVQLLTAGPGTANQNFREALEVVPDYPMAYFSIGNAYRKKFGSSKNLQDLKEAETNLLKARELAPQNPQFALELGIMYSQQLAVSDKDNEEKYQQEAVKHWKDYIKLGGADIGTVEAWIREIEA